MDTRDYHLLYLRMRMHTVQVVILEPYRYLSPYFVRLGRLPLRSSLWKFQGTIFVALSLPPPTSLLHCNVSPKPYCSTSEIQRRSFCVCVCPVGIHVARQINNYRLTKCTTLQGEKDHFWSVWCQTWEGPKLHWGKRRRQLWCAFSLSLLTLFPVIIMSGVMGMCKKKKKVTKAGQLPH